MSNGALLTLVWLAFSVHAAVGVTVVGLYHGKIPLIPLLYLVTALCVVGYWVTWWYVYLINGIRWYASDQLVPLYALTVCVLSLWTLVGRYSGSWPHWIVFGIDTAVLFAAAMFFSLLAGPPTRLI